VIHIQDIVVKAFPVHFVGLNLTWKIMLMEHFGCISSVLIYMKEGILENSLVVRKVI
jgi:hypothetical protein